MPRTYMSVPELASELGCKATAITDLAARADDPLPLRYLPGRVRYGFVVVEEFNGWLYANGRTYAEIE